MGTYPNGGNPPQNPVDTGSKVVVQVHEAAHQFAFTGGDVVALVAIAALLIIAGAMVWYVARNKEAVA